LYLEVNGLKELVSRHVGVLGLGRISIAQENVMEPVRHDCVLVHQVTNAFQHCLEIVLLQQASGNSLGSQKMLADNNAPMTIRHPIKMLARCILRLNTVQALLKGHQAKDACV